MEPNGNKLRVAMVGGYNPDPARYHGGVQAASAYLVKGLSRIDELELHILVLRPPAWAGPDCFDQDGVRVHLLPPYPRFERLRGYRNFQSILNRALAEIQPAVLHAQEAASDAYVAILSGFPTVITAHGIRAEDLKFVRSWRLRMRFYYDALVTESRVMRKVKYLIAISRYITNYFAPLLRRDVNLNYIPNAVDESFFKLSDHSQKPVVLFVGRLMPRKRVLDLAQAFAQVHTRVPQAELHIVGETATDPVYVNTVRTYIQQAGLGARVKLLGELSQEELLREYAACTLVTLCSSEETLPVVIAQAMAAGKPTVATCVGGVADLLGPNCERGLLVKVGDVDGLAAGMAQLLQNPGLCARIGQAGRAFALDNYHLDRVAQRTFATYRYIAATEPRINA